MPESMPNSTVQPLPNLDLGSGLGESRWWRAFLSLTLMITGTLVIGSRDMHQDRGQLDLKVESQGEITVPTEDLLPTNKEAAPKPGNRQRQIADAKAKRYTTIAIGKGDTLGKLLSDQGASGQEAHNIIKAMSPFLSPKKIQLGQEVKVGFVNTDITEVVLKTGFGSQLSINKTNAGTYEARESEMAIETRPVYREGRIDDSLYLSGERAGVPASVLIELIQIYSFSVDFQREIRKGDSFRLLFDELTAEDGEIKRGPILYAELELRGEKRPLYRFTPSDDKRTDYFSADGKSTRRLLMKTPIDGARLTSRFGRRKHPVLGYVKSHRGVDFGAPTGTPIYAAGDGIVERASRFGSYGNYIRIRHNGTYKTAYAHLSKYGRGIKKGRRVKQGQIIGYVGATGRVTGAHLHYEVLQNDKRVNPLSLKLPSGRDLHKTELKLFNVEKSVINDLIDTNNHSVSTTRILNAGAKTQAAANE